MWKRISFLKHHFTVLLILGICLALGCAKSDSPKDKTEGTQTSARSSSERSSSDNGKRIVGVWLGTATLDQAKLQGKLELMVAEQQQIIAAQAQSFLSTTMAIEYRQDGSLENDLELVSVNGQLMRDGSVGTWKIIESTPEGVVIETQEQMSDGTTCTSQFSYRFLDEGNQFVVAVPVSEDLRECDAMLVFERQNLPPIEIAAGSIDTQTK